jgi:hypothetical protein
MSFAKHPVRAPAAGWAFYDYRLRTNNCKKQPIRHAEGGQVERGLGSFSEPMVDL